MNIPTNNTRTFPRSMRQAFGPYTDDVLYPMPERRRHIPARRLKRRAVVLVGRAIIFVAGH
jgi:hypothetical protein